MTANVMHTVASVYFRMSVFSRASLYGQSPRLKAVSVRFGGNFASRLCFMYGVKRVSEGDGYTEQNAPNSMGL